MTPELKAKELVGRYLILFPNSHIHLSKKCALISVAELIKYLPSSNGNPPNLQEYESNSEFWEKVREEINKL